MLKQTQKKRDYKRDLDRAFRSSVMEMVFWAVLSLVFAALSLYLGLRGQLLPRLAGYRQAGLLFSGVLFVLVLARLLLAVTEHLALKDVAREAVYAVMLTPQQQDRIFRSLSHQRVVEHFGYFLMGSLPVSVLMTIIYLRTKDTSPLLAMAIVNLVLFLSVLVCYLLDAAQIASNDAFCTVSDDGIVTAEEIMPFTAEDGDVKALVEFDDCYSVWFEKTAYLGLRRLVEFPLPKGGAISNAIEGEEKEVLLRTFGLQRSLVVEGPYREMPFRQLPFEQVKEEEEETPKKNLSGILQKVAIVLALLAVVAVGYALVSRTETPTVNPTPSTPPIDETSVPNEPPFKDVLPKSELAQDEEGIWYATVGGTKVILVNKTHPLPREYGGVNEEASEALRAMIEAAAAEDVRIQFVSGYRSYSLQESLLARKLAEVGEIGRQLVAPPGCSEHQTGLAFDVNETGNDGTLLSKRFEGTAAFRWLQEHCAEYGFILRYTSGDEEITGYSYEPWHYRYVGVDVAKDIQASGLTLEEYLNAVDNVEESD